MNPSRTSSDPEEPVGAALARLRRSQRMSGARLADLVGMSQPKISRIERSVGTPDPADVADIARALGADEALVQQLVDRARAAHNRLADWRPTPTALAGSQEQVRRWEKSASVICDFQPIVLPGLLQTSGYARTVLTAFQEMIQVDGGTGDLSAVLPAVSARIQRQEVLGDFRKSFRFVLLEATLRNSPCPPMEMLAQLNFLDEVIQRQKNIEIRIVPEGEQLKFPPMHGFVIYDDSFLVVDSYNTGLISHGRTDVAQYRFLFDYFTEKSTGEVGSVFDRYRKIYLDLLT